jgi:hypothetical protein
MCRLLTAHLVFHLMSRCSVVCGLWYFYFWPPTYTCYIYIYYRVTGPGRRPGVRLHLLDSIRKLFFHFNSKLAISKVRYQKRETVCSLWMTAVVQIVSYALDKSRNMAAVCARSLKLSVTGSLKRNCSVVCRPGRKVNFSSGMWHDNAG